MQSEPAKLPSAFKLFEPSLEALKVNVIGLALLILTPAAALLVMVLFIVMAAAIGSTSDAALVVSSFFIFAAIMATIVLFLFINPATTLMQLKSARGEQMTYSQAFKFGTPFWLRYLGLSICMGFIIGIGFLLFIVPGLFMMRRYILAPYYMIDRNLGVFDSLRQCAEDSKHFSGPIWGLIGVQFLVGLVNMFPFGFIVTVLYLCAPAVRYLEIKHAAQGHHTPAAPHTPHAQPAASL